MMMYALFFFIDILVGFKKRKDRATAEMTQVSQLIASRSRRDGSCFLFHSYDKTAYFGIVYTYGVAILYLESCRRQMRLWCRKLRSCVFAFRTKWKRKDSSRIPITNKEERYCSENVDGQFDGGGDEG